MGICNQEVADDFAEKIVKTRDCMSMGMLIALNQHKNKLLVFINDEIDFLIQNTTVTSTGSCSMN